MLQKACGADRLDVVELLIDGFLFLSLISLSISSKAFFLCTTEEQIQPLPIVRGFLVLIILLKMEVKQKVLRCFC